MTTSKYFNHLEVKGEHELYNDIVVESIKISGFDVTYMRRSNFIIDPVLYEPNKSLFEEGFVIEANIPDNLMGWEGEGNIMSQFGIQVQNSGQVLFSISRWNEIQEERKANGLTPLDRPYEGDLIYFGYGYTKYNNTLLQINQVDFSNATFQLGRNFVFRCHCTLYSPNYNDKFNLPTGLPADGVADQVQGCIDGDEILRQNENTKVISDSFREFSETNPFGDL